MDTPKTDFTGRVYSDLTVLRYFDTVQGKTPKQRNRRWLCRCICGNETIVRGADLNNGITKSCGCLKTRKPARLRHGHAPKNGRKSPTWMSWVAMRSERTVISHDPAWDSFETFLADMGERPDGMSLDRIDGSKGYSKDNCRWATRKTQTKNRKNTKWLTHNGRTQTAMEWANELGVSYNMIISRLHRGWSVERALTPHSLALGRSPS